MALIWFIMALVPYLLGGEEILAKQMSGTVSVDSINGLFSEFDRKVSIALDNHALPYLIGTDKTQTIKNFQTYLGPRFVFRKDVGQFGNGKLFTGYFLQTGTYTHSTFTNGISGAGRYTGSEVNGVDEQHKAIVYNPITPNLSGSLEAHRADYNGSKYWILQGGQVVIGFTIGRFGNQIPVFGIRVTAMERIRVYEQAELMFEGVTTQDFDSAWNKYNFFRVHNFNPSPLAITFHNANTESGSVLLTVPAYGSRCIRRDLVSGSYIDNPVYEYTEGFNYFQKFRKGDPRFYQHGSGLINSSQFYGVNNVFNPSIIIPFTNQILAGRAMPDGTQFCAPFAILDPHVRAPLPDGYVNPVGEPKLLYANPDDDTAILADCLHHSGDLLIKSLPFHAGIAAGDLRVKWSGYQAPLPKLANGVDALVVSIVGNTYQIKSTIPNTELVSLSTNLTRACGLKFSGNVLRNGAYYIVDNQVPNTGLSFYKGFIKADANTQSLQYTALNGSVVTIPATPKKLVGSVKHSFDAIVTWRDTIALTKATLNNPLLCSFVAAQLELTSSGLLFKTTQTVPLSAPPSFVSDATFPGEAALWQSLSGNIIKPLALNAFLTTDGYNLTIKRALAFTNYGWPDIDLWVYTGFLTPRLARWYSDRAASNTPHPDFSEGLQNLNGEEIIYNGGDKIIETEIAIISPWNQANVVQPASSGGSPFNTVYDLNSVHNQTVGLMQSDGGPQSTAPYDALFQATKGGASNNGVGLFIRMPMCVEMFNNLAAKVNSIAKIQPLNFIDHGILPTVPFDDAIRQRAPQPNKRSIIDELSTGSYPFFTTLNPAQQSDFINVQMQQFSGLRPASQYLSFAGLTPSSISQTTIPIHNSSDLPQWSLIETKRKTLADQFKRGGVIPLRDDGVVTISTGIARQYTVVFSSLIQQSNTLYCRDDLRAITNYKWIDANDVKVYAESLGYKFIFTQFGPRFDLIKVDVDNSGPQNDITLYSSNPNSVVTSFPVNDTRKIRPGAEYKYPEGVVVEFLPSTTGEWITGSDLLSVNLQPLNTEKLITSGHITLLASPGESFFMFGDFRVIESAEATYVYTLPFYLGGSPVHSYANAFTLNPLVVNATVSDERILKVLWPRLNNLLNETMRNPYDWCINNKVLVCDQEPIAVKVISDGVNDRCVVMKSPVPSFDFTNNFSGESQASRDFFTLNGPGVLPATVNPSGAKRLQLFADFTIDV